MVTSDGLVKILDFGLARRTPHASDVGSGITREGTVLGTVEYMSPEQAAARPHDHRSDQFSFGAILYEMATGRRAFERDTAPQTLAAIIEDEPEPLRALNADVPAGLSAIVERCLAKDPDRRYASTADLVRELALVSAPAIPAPLGRPTRRRAAIGLALVAGVAAFVVFRYASRPDAPVPRGDPAGSSSVHELHRARGGAHVLSGWGASGVHVGWREPGQSRHLRQGDRRGAAAPPDLRSCAGTGARPGRPTARGSPSSATSPGAARRCASSLPPADPSARSVRCRAWPTRGSRGLPTAAPWPSSIDRRLESAPGSSCWTS